MDDREDRLSNSIEGKHNTNTLWRVFAEHQGHIADKWEQYITVYEATLARFVASGRPVRVLEIGVQNGGSLQVWSKYFPRDSMIVGIDIDPACAQLWLGPNITVLIGDASDPAELDRILGNAHFDIIIDDGSHRSEHIIATFTNCFGRLDPGGVYFVEDIHASYFASHGGGFRDPGTAMEWFKGLLDALHSDHFQDDAIEKLGLSALKCLRRAGQQIASVTFLDSMIIIDKLTAEKRRPYRRIMTGREAPIADIAARVFPSWPASQLRELLLPPPTVAAFTPAILNEIAAARDQVNEVQAALVQAESRAVTSEAQTKLLRISLARAEAQASASEEHAEASEIARAQLAGRLAVADQVAENLNAILAKEQEGSARCLVDLQEESVRTIRKVRSEELAARQAIIEMYEMSCSWRMTSPLRFAISVLLGKRR